MLRKLTVLFMLLAAAILLGEAYALLSSTGLDSFTVPEMQPQVIVYRTESELAESLLLLAPVVLLWGRLNLSSITEVWSRRSILTHGWRRVCLGVALTGFSVFAVFVGADVWRGLFGAPSEVGVAGFLSFCAGVVGTVGYRIGEGFGKSLTDAVVFVAAPLLTIFELAIWLFFPLQMSWFATNFTRPLAFDGVYLVSNWLVLNVSVFVLGLGISSWVKGQNRNFVRTKMKGTSIGSEATDLTETYELGALIETPGILRQKGQLR
jgi:hypothetical protein